MATPAGIGTKTCGVPDFIPESAATEWGAPPRYSFIGRDNGKVPFFSVGIDHAKGLEITRGSTLCQEVFGSPRVVIDLIRAYSLGMTPMTEPLCSFMMIPEFLPFRLGPLP